MKFCEFISIIVITQLCYDGNMVIAFENVEVLCSWESMRVELLFEEPFSGRVSSSQCVAYGDGERRLRVEFALDVVNRWRCGIDENNDEYMAVLDVKVNPEVITAGDTVYAVRCPIRYPFQTAPKNFGDNNENDSTKPERLFTAATKKLESEMRPLNKMPINKLEIAHNKENEIKRFISVAMPANTHHTMMSENDLMDMVRPSMPTPATQTANRAIMISDQNQMSPTKFEPSIKMERIRDRLNVTQLMIPIRKALRDSVRDTRLGKCVAYNGTFVLRGRTYEFVQLTDEVQFITWDTICIWGPIDINGCPFPLGLNPAEQQDETRDAARAYTIESRTARFFAHCHVIVCGDGVCENTPRCTRERDNDASVFIVEDDADPTVRNTTARERIAAAPSAQFEHAAKDEDDITIYNEEIWADFTTITVGVLLFFGTFIMVVIALQFMQGPNEFKKLLDYIYSVRFLMVFHHNGRAREIHTSVIDSDRVENEAGRGANALLSLDTLPAPPSIPFHFSATLPQGNRAPPIDDPIYRKPRTSTTATMLQESTTVTVIKRREIDSENDRSEVRVVVELSFEEDSRRPKSPKSENFNSNSSSLESAKVEEIFPKRFSSSDHSDEFFNKLKWIQIKNDDKSSSEFIHFITNNPPKADSDELNSLERIDASVKTTTESTDEKPEEVLESSLEDLLEHEDVQFTNETKQVRKKFLKETLAQPQYSQMCERIRTLRKQYGGYRKFKQPPQGILKNVEELQNVNRSGDQHIVKNVPTIRKINEQIGDLLIGGDMLLSNGHFENENRSRLVDLLNGKHAREKRQLQAGWRRKWLPGIPISYYFDSSIDETTRRIIRLAANFWTENTCMTFKENGTTQPRVRFFKGVGCYSDVGKAKLFGSQDVSIGYGCDLFGTITHEMGHVLGLFHHHSRNDRDKYITLMLGAIDAIWRAQYAKELFSENYGVGYDYGSVMHYSGYKPQSDSIEMVAKEKKYQHTMGNNYGPMFTDLLAINKYYNCASRCSNGAECKNGGFRNSRRCEECICPNGFGGADCAERAAGEGDASADCGASVQADSDWQTLNGSVETKAFPKGRHFSDRSAGCHFHIKAPADARIEMELVFIDGTCSPDCYFGALDIKVDDMTKGGIRACCDSHREDIGKLVSARELIVMSLYTQKDKRVFSVRYRIYEEETSTQPSSTFFTQLDVVEQNFGGIIFSSESTLTSTSSTTTSITSKPNCADASGFKCLNRFVRFACSFWSLTQQLCQRSCGLC